MRWSPGKCVASVVIKPQVQMSSRTSSRAPSSQAGGHCPELLLAFFFPSHGPSCDLSDNRTRVCKPAFLGCCKTLLELLSTALCFKWCCDGSDTFTLPSPCAEPQVWPRAWPYPESKVSKQWYAHPSCCRQVGFQGTSLFPLSR